ncbi:MAG: hypothetical protein V5A44_07280 [Haloarculaceae archaeon]
MGSRESPYPNFLWRRWDGDGSDEKTEAAALSERRLFEFCAVPFAGDSLLEDRSSRISDGGDEDGRDAAVERDPVSFLPPGVRLLLRHVPTLVLIFFVAVLVEAELSPGTRGVSTLLPQVPLVPLVYLVVGATALLYVLVRSDVVDGETLVKAAFVYGLAGVLLAGSAYGTYLTLETRGGVETTPYVVYTFPTLLFTLVIGLLAYDLLLRGEHLYTHLGRKNIIIGSRVGETAGDESGSGIDLYERIKQRELVSKLEGGVGPARYGHLFALLVLSQYLLIWSFKGPLGTGLWSSLLLNLTVNLVVLVGVFNFIVGIIFLRGLLNGEYATEDGDRLQPQYLPFHPDRQGGFADIGRLAMRINVIFILIGGYYVYRAYVSGIRTFPGSEGLSFAPLYSGFVGIEATPVLELVFWSVNFLGPVCLYALVVTVWFYYTFWEIHKQMSKQKKDLILEKQSERIESAGEGRSEGTQRHPLGEYSDKDDWMALYDAPEWPVNTQKLGGLITGNVVPILFSIPTVVPDLLAAWG